MHTLDQQDRGDASAKQKRAFGGNVGNVDNAERDHHAERDERVDQPLHQRDRHQVPEAEQNLHLALTPHRGGGFAHPPRRSGGPIPGR